MYCSQVAGFFVIESYVQRVTDGLVGPAEGAALWAGAQRSLKATLEAAFEQLSTASLMLMVKDFVLLVCVALERAGYQVIGQQHFECSDPSAASMLASSSASAS
jgi:hypothetical protein